MVGMRSIQKGRKSLFSLLSQTWECEVTGGALCDFYAVCAASRAKTGMTRLLQQFHVQMVLVVLKLIVSGLNFDKKK